MRKCTNIFTIYEEVVSQYMTLHTIPLNFLIYEGNFFIFFFIGAGWRADTTTLFLTPHTVDCLKNLAQLEEEGTEREF